MTSPKTKNRFVLLIAVGALLLAAFGVLTVTYTVKGLARERTMREYLSPYEEKAIAYLRTNETFTEAYGEDVTLESRSMTYGYLDPKKYTGLSLNPQIPATAEEFEAELAHLYVSFDLPDLRSLNVNFEKTPEGDLEITGWEYADE